MVYEQLSLYPGSLPVAEVVCEKAAVYRPRHPERLDFYRILEQHFEHYLYAYEERSLARARYARSFNAASTRSSTVAAFMAVLPG